jgi:site-specific DNA-cytosine methylase
MRIAILISAKLILQNMQTTIDILTGGFPCQPFSMAGKRKGTEDERYLWGEMLRAIQEIKPKFVIAENVFGITNIDGGLVFEQVCLDLEAEGYEVQPFIIPACAKNAPHRRDRCWFIATNEPNCNDRRSTDSKGGCEESKANGEGEQSIHFRIGATSDEGMLPTPTATDFKGAYPPTSINNNENENQCLRTLYNGTEIKIHSKNSQLNPRFVAEMMGFPPNWTELPFLNGGQKVLKDTETP